MKALLLIAHGSRSAIANHEIGTLAAQLRSNIDGIELVEHAFLEMAEPTIVQGGNKLVAAGANEIIILPYFLSAGKHVAEDVPAEVALIQKQHPNIKISMRTHLGAASGMQSLIDSHLPSTT